MGRMFQRVAAAALFAAALLAGLPAGAEECKEGQYQLKRANEDYMTIATMKLGTMKRWKEIKNANPGVDPLALRVGQCINLPVDPATSLPVSPPMVVPAADEGASEGGQRLRELTQEASGSAAAAESNSTLAVNLGRETEKKADHAEKVAELAGHNHAFVGLVFWLGLTVPTTGGVVGYEFGPPDGEAGWLSRLSVMVGAASPTRGFNTVSDVINPGVGVAGVLPIGYRWAIGLDVSGVLRLGGQSDEKFVPRTTYFGGGAEVGWYLGWLRLALEGVVEGGLLDPTATSLSDGGRPWFAFPSWGGAFTITGELPNF